MTETITLIYAGRRMTVDHKLAYFYAGIGDSDLRGFSKALVAGVRVGAVVEVRADDEGRYWTGGPDAPRVTGYADDDARLLEWAALDRAASMEQSARAESRRIARAGADPLKAQLEPVREVLRGMSPDRRAATTGWILQYLLSGVTR